MNRNEQVRQYRNKRYEKGWSSFSVIVPKECQEALKKFYKEWRHANWTLWDIKEGRGE